MRTSRLLSAVFLGLAMVSVGCSGGGAPSPATSLTIAEPRSGATVASSLLTVRGTAPAGARVVHDISFGLDDETVADAACAWSMQVELDPGENVLTFRLDDESTERSVAVTLAEQSACADAFAAAAAVDEMNDSVTDLYPAVRACSLGEWRAEFERHDGLRFSGTADSVLANMCLSGEIQDTALCSALR